MTSLGQLQRSAVLTCTLADSCFGEEEIPSTLKGSVTLQKLSLESEHSQFRKFHLDCIAGTRKIKRGSCAERFKLIKILSKNLKTTA